MSSHSKTYCPVCGNAHATGEKCVQCVFTGRGPHVTLENGQYVEIEREAREIMDATRPYFERMAALMEVSPEQHSALSNAVLADLAAEARDAAALKIRTDFDAKWTNVWKCSRCGSVHADKGTCLRYLNLHLGVVCEGEIVQHGYTPLKRSAP